MLKTSRDRVDHFAHLHPLHCRYGASESPVHRICKMEIYQALQKEPHVTSLQLERPLGTVRPDISAYFGDILVAIEVQISSLSVEEIRYRTLEYFRKGIYVLWLLPCTPNLNGKRYSPSLWEKWIHAAYFGRVYYWMEGLSVIPYHFAPSFLSVPARSWHTKRGKEMTAGGYSKKSKRYRTPIRGQTLNLALDFVPKDRDCWEGNGIVVPYAKLFIDSCPQTYPYKNSGIPPERV